MARSYPGHTPSDTTSRRLHPQLDVEVARAVAVAADVPAPALAVDLVLPIEAQHSPTDAAEVQIALVGSACGHRLGRRRGDPPVRGRTLLPALEPTPQSPTHASHRR